MEPRGGWKCRRLAAVPGNCHCSRVDGGTAGQRRGSSGGGELAPGGCALQTVQPFPDSFPTATGICRACFLRPSYLVPRGRARAGMHWKQESLASSRPCRLGSVWVDLEGAGGSIGTDLATLPL